MTRREELEAEIKQVEAHLADLGGEVEAAKKRLAALRMELFQMVSRQVGSLPAASSPGGCVPATNAEKLALFRSLFRGREEVFPRRWENTRKGTAGYSPACANEWQLGLCAKQGGRGRGKKATCGECSHQAFIPLSDIEVAKHLRGEQVIGVYPLLPDETCWFLAADFDKGSWQEDMAAFVETCTHYGVPVAVERSRSGQGGHAWFFFTTPVAAASARKLGCFLLTETMDRRPQLSLESYDRLFPNQDTLPRGGLGNLIALPLQREARDAGNSVFVDGAFQPWPDQWAFLAGVERIEPARVQSLAEAARRRGQVIGVRTGEGADGFDREPWTRPPSGSPGKDLVKEPLPAVVRAVLCQRLFIEKDALPPLLRNRLMRLAAFQNPEFYRRQGMRLSTARTPRVISCAEDLSGHIVLPRGCLPAAETLLHDQGVHLEVRDERVQGEPLECTFQGTLTPLQDKAVKALSAHDTGVFVAPPGIGKTVVGIFMIAARRRSTLILVHRKPLLDQWVAQLALFLGIDKKAIGRIGGGRRTPRGRIDVAMVQSLVRRGSVADVVAGYGHVILDEAHHCPAVSFEGVLAEVKARYVLGLTATPHRRDGHHPVLPMQLGPVRFQVDAGSQAAGRPFAHKLIVRETGFTGEGLAAGAGIQELYGALAADPRRNDLIFDDLVGSLEAKRSPLLLTERRDHLEHFARRLEGFTRHLVVLHGGMKVKERRAAMAELAAIPEGEERVVIATGRYIGEGFDDARLDTLFLALPVSWKGTLIQYTGRLHRLHPGKTEVRIHDYLDSRVPMLAKMFEKRLRGYRAIGYTLEEVDRDGRVPEKGARIEYDLDQPFFPEEDL